MLDYQYEADLPDIDLQNIQTDADLPDFEAPPNEFFNETEMHSLLEDVNTYDNEFLPIHHPVSRAGVKVNRNGEVMLQNDDEEAAKTLRIRFMDQNYIKVPNRNNNLFLISKDNRDKFGPIVALDIYRDGTWLKAYDFHLPTEIIKTFREQFRWDEIEVLYIDGDNTNCCLDNLVAKIIVNDRMKYSPCDLVPPLHIWTKAKLWNGDVLPNYYCSFDGNIALIWVTAYTQEK